MAYTHPVPQTSFAQNKPVAVRAEAGSPATADASLPSDISAGTHGLFTNSKAEKVRFGLLLDGGASPTATILIWQWVECATSWILLDTQTTKTSGYSWEVSMPPGTYFTNISALANSPTKVCVTAQAASLFT